MAEPGQVVLRVICRLDGIPTAADRRYVVEYDPTLAWDLEAGDRTFKLVTSADIRKARGFPGVREAAEYLRLICPNVPIANGQPNRPLTAFTVELATAP
jgi:hypothetical protein